MHNIEESLSAYPNNVYVNYETNYMSSYHNMKTYVTEKEICMRAYHFWCHYPEMYNVTQKHLCYVPWVIFPNPAILKSQNYLSKARLFKWSSFITTIPSDRYRFAFLHYLFHHPQNPIPLIQAAEYPKNLSAPFWLSTIHGKLYFQTLQRYQQRNSDRRRFWLLGSTRIFNGQSCVRNVLPLSLFVHTEKTN